MLRRCLIVELAWFVFLALSYAQVSPAAPLSANSERISYTFQGTASGAFQPDHGAATSFRFVKAPFAITAIVEVSSIVPSTQHCAVSLGACKIWSAPVAFASISVAGVTATITSPLAVFDNQTFPSLGLARRTGGDFLDLQGSSAFAHYDLTDDLALQEVFFKKPTALAQFNCAPDCIMTTMGALGVDTVQDVRFAAAEVRPAQ